MKQKVGRGLAVEVGWVGGQHVQYPRQVRVCAGLLPVDATVKPWIKHQHSVKCRRRWRDGGLDRPLVRASRRFWRYVTWGPSRLLACAYMCASPRPMRITSHPFPEPKMGSDDKFNPAL